MKLACKQCSVIALALLGITLKFYDPLLLRLEAGCLRMIALNVFKLKSFTILRRD